MTFKNYASQLEEIVDKMLEIADNQSESSSRFLKLLICSRNNKQFVLEIEADVVLASCLSYLAGVSFPAEVVDHLKGLNLAEQVLHILARTLAVLTLLSVPNTLKVASWMVYSKSTC